MVVKTKKKIEDIDEMRNIRIVYKVLGIQYKDHSAIYIN
jgi:hypothetical protein